jgi:CheY-like chemotaxis protein
MSRKKQTGSILIVEDEGDLNEAYCMILIKAGYNVATSFDGLEALEKLHQSTPDLILLDLRMPRMDGIKFLQKAHLKQDFPSTKVIVFSNYDMQKEIDEAYQLGAERYILKAWASPKELLQVVEETLAL